MSALDWAVPLLRCPVCHGGLRLSAEPEDGEQGQLAHEDARCVEVYPVIDGVPRLLVGTERSVLVRDRAHWFQGTPGRRAIAARWSGPVVEDRLVRGFDAEWSRFDAVRSAELSTVFDMYFDLVPDHLKSSDQTVLDAGCGAGRWAIELASRGTRVLAIDLGRSIDIAHRNAAGMDRIACVHADLRALPVRDGAVDWAYSLGVLHHLDRPGPALANIVRAVRPGGLVLLYLYYALNRRAIAYRALFRLADVIRRVTSRAPHTVVLVVSTAVAILVYWPLARLSALLAQAGLRSLALAIPLSFYRDRSLRFMRNDSLDRFGTSIEHRYTRGAMEQLMRSADMSQIRFSDRAPYWHAVGVRE